MKLKAREKVLLAVLAAVASIQVIRLLPDSLEGGPLTLARKSPTRRAAEELRPAAVAHLDIEVLDAASGRTEVGRDPFRFGLPPASRRPPPAPQREDDRRRGTPETDPAAERRPPPIRYSYLGSFGTERLQVAVFSDGEAIVNAQVGQALDDALVVEAIDRESVEIRFVDFPDHPPRRLRVGP
ncbi:MAG: hypothetical protein R3190_02880 [Thermoanaerobaculia bacterium]|nr:hypothetical protein [Thermoanaerobaculia bacterium]